MYTHTHELSYVLCVVTSYSARRPVQPILCIITLLLFISFTCTMYYVLCFIRLQLDTLYYVLLHYTQQDVLMIYVIYIICLKEYCIKM